MFPWRFVSTKRLLGRSSAGPNFAARHIETLYRTSHPSAMILYPKSKVKENWKIVQASLATRPQQLLMKLEPDIFEIFTSKFCLKFQRIQKKDPYLLKATNLLSNLVLSSSSDDPSLTRNFGILLEKKFGRSKSLVE